MENKNYTKYSEHSNNDKHVVSKELEETVLRAGGEVMRTNPVEENWTVTEEKDGVHVRPVVDGEIINTPVEEVLKPKLEEDSKEPTVEDIRSVTIKDCNKLNVRKDPNKESKVLCVIDKNTEFTVNLTKSTEDFYKVTLSNGVEGYCMKEFISIK